jgi:hypothetical protein
MRTIPAKIIIAAFLIVMLTATGCVAPPEGSTTTGPVDLYDPNKFSSVTPGETQNILASATPFQTATTTTMGYNVIQTTRVIPEDQVCLIEFSHMNMTFETNHTARKFNLINPPMYVNYNISKPFNVSGTRLITEKGIEKTIMYSYYAPQSYLEITIRDPTTGNIFLQDGFGKEHGSWLNKTVQITKSGNLLIEISGYNVSSYMSFWVKPSNINPEAINISTLDCKTQDYVKKLNQ